MSVGRSAAIVFASSGIPVVLLRLIGHYDLFTVAGGLLLGFFKHPAIVVFGGFLLGGNNFEQGVIVVASWAIARWVFEGEISWRSLGAAAGGVLAGLLLMKAVRVLEPSASASRFGLLGGNFYRSAAGSLSLGNHLIWSGYGASWPLILSPLLDVKGMRRWLFLIALVGLPLLLTALTLDGTRVFVCCSTAAFVVVLRNEVVRETRLSKIAAVATLLFFLTPATFTWAGGELSGPWQWVVDKVAPGVRVPPPRRSLRKSKASNQSKPSAKVRESATAIEATVGDSRPRVGNEE